MFADWNIYYKPLHLNNTTGVGIAGGDIAGASTTPFVVLAEADGNSYTPKTTNYMDVYSGGSPFTFTQELVQRGAEVQEDSIRIAIIGTTPQDCADKLQQLRTALTNQHLFGPQILSIKKLGQSQYTEWLIHGAVVQEETTYLGRDIQDNGYPSLFVTITITRSPYGSDSFPLYTYTQNYPINAQFQSIPNTNVLDNPHLYGSFVNFYINLYNPAQIYAPATLGSTVIATTIEDTKIVDTTAVSGSLAYNTQVVAKTVSYPITDTSNGNYPIQVFVIATVQSNDIEMRLNVGGYSTPYTRSIGTQLKPTTVSSTRRLFVLPAININNLFSGARDYGVFYNVDLSIELRHAVNIVANRTYTIHEVYVCRIDNIIQVFPTTVWNTKYYDRATMSVNSFYDQLNYPAQSLPFIKGQFTQYNNITTTYNNFSVFEETLEIRGTNMIVKKQYGDFSYIVFTTGYNGDSPDYNTQSALENVVVRFAPSYLSIKE